MTKILMVCMGNICRSPMAQVVAARTAALAEREVPSGPERLAFDSAGTHAHHVGERMDPRAAAALAARGYPTGKGRSRRVCDADFEKFDLILAMDRGNLVNLQSVCPAPHHGKLGLLLDFADGLHGEDVPDPYYGNAQGFERVLDLCEVGARGLIRTLYLENQHGRP
ncbi:low molecular weight protein-tyrosine-phosphatase [Rhodoferax sp.]|uniref:low molecular weight protein-tyrosine-phosphatase n=1 Tax=Rhodoferax sp. TaxID=50421 RepID=UPI0027709820|nr:low molecular weight protein-tyrosine-phosphatase [Rhodoferax sp.]